jgi:hypothetical protein
MCYASMLNHNDDISMLHKVAMVRQRVRVIAEESSINSSSLSEESEMLSE